MKTVERKDFTNRGRIRVIHVYTYDSISELTSLQVKIAVINYSCNRKVIRTNYSGSKKN